MKTNTLEIAISLFNCQISKFLLGRGMASPESALILALSSPKQVQEAAFWLETLCQKTRIAKTTPLYKNIDASFLRVYAEKEKQKLGEAGISLIEELVRIQLLAPSQREIVIDQIEQLDLDNDEIPIHHLRLVLFIVLANGVKNTQQLYWLDCLILRNPQNKTIH